MNSRNLYRAMKAANDGRPLCGSARDLLGVRHDEIPSDGAGRVFPATGGLSVFTDDPAYLPRHLRPASVMPNGGKGKHPVFEISTHHLGESLIFREKPTVPTHHGFIEPAQIMLLEEYQQSLAATAPNWLRLP